jgi:non-ribosomal peptide synthase protein (TIGR01720 family)
VDAAAGELLKVVKEQVRSVPGDGLGFGLLRYLNPDTGPVLAGLAGPQIGFNYLGHFPAGDGGWRMGGETDPAMPAAHALEAGALVRDQPAGPELTAWLAFPSHLLDKAAASELAGHWAEVLTKLAALATDPAAGGHTPSDFPLLTLDQNQLDELEAGFSGATHDGSTR